MVNTLVKKCVRIALSVPSPGDGLPGKDLLLNLKKIRVNKRGVSFLGGVYIKITLVGIHFDLIMGLFHPKRKIYILTPSTLSGAISTLGCMCTLSGVISPLGRITPRC